MGRKKIFREKVIYMTSSVAIKNPIKWLVDVTIEDYGLSIGEAEMVAQKAYQYLTRKVSPQHSQQITYPLIAGRNTHSKKNQSCKDVMLTPFSFEDLELHEEFGLKAMQIGRLLRLVEEAYQQDALFSMLKLSFLTTIEMNSLRDRLKPLWEMGIRLPISGMKKTTRSHFRQYRATDAMKQLLMGKRPSCIRKAMYLSRSQMDQYRLDLHTVAAEGADALGEKSLPDLGEELKQLANEFKVKPKLPPLMGKVGTSDELIQYLRSGHDFSPLKADSYLNMLDEYVLEEAAEDRPVNTVTYWAIAGDEPAGKSITECQLVAVPLEYYTKEEEACYDGNRTRNLKWQRMLRLATQARYGGGLLSQADLSFLLGLHPGVIQKMLKENKNIELPTRGWVNDIGPGLTHIEKIIDLYLQGYTETEIKQRTAHSYEAIENYLHTFAKVMVLTEQGMPLLMIRKVLGKSRKLVETHLALYEQYKNLPGAQLVLMHLRNSFKIKEVKHFFRPTPRKESDTIKRKGNAFASLTQKSIVNAQIYVLRERYDFTKESWLAQQIVAEFNTQMKVYEQENNLERLEPGNLKTLHQGQEVIIPLLEEKCIAKLVETGQWRKVSRTLEKTRLTTLKAIDPSTTLEDLQRIVNPRALVNKYSPNVSKSKPRSPSQWPLLNPHQVGARVKKCYLAPDDVSVPEIVNERMVAYMCQEKISQERAQAAINELVYIRSVYCPLATDIQPGQVVWIGISICDKQQKEKQTCYRQQIPLILTLQTPEELEAELHTVADVNKLQQHQIARMSMEAYLQGSVLPLVDYQMMTFRYYFTLSALVNDYMKENEVILPTPGTIKDAGRAITHKYIAISLHLEGFYTKDIARKTFHREESIDKYLNLFVVVLILYLHDMPVEMMARVTGRGVTLLQEHLKIVKEHFPNKSSVKSYLKAHGDIIV